MFDDLHRPLGRDLPRRRPAHRFRLSRLLPAATVLAILGGSAATALLQPALRRVDVFEDAARAGVAGAEAPTMPVTPAPRRDAPPPVEPDLPTISYPPDTAGPAGQLVAVSDPASLRQPPAMAAVPDEALIEPGDAGPLPIRAADGRRPFDVYSVDPASGVGTRIAIVVGGLGISQTGTQAAIRTLPPGVTLAFAPAGNSLGRWMQEARRSGHELLLQAPMEPFGYPQLSPGPDTVTAADAAAGDFASFHRSLARLTNYVGVMNYMGARLTADPAAMRPFLGELSRRGLLYLDDASSSRSVARDVAREAGTVFAAADVLLDGSPEPGAIARQLETLERVARADGSAIGIASAFDVSVEAIAAFVEAAEQRGIRIVPISALAVDPERR